MQKPPFNPKWSFRSRGIQEESFRRRILKRYDEFLNRQMDKLPPNLRYLKMPMRPISIAILISLVFANNMIIKRIS